MSFQQGLVRLESMNGSSKKQDHNGWPQKA